MKLILLPGLDGNGALFERLVHCIGQQYECVVVRYPQRADWILSDYVEYATQHIGNDEQVILLGESFSGSVAVSLAVQLGERCKALILAASFCRSPRWLLRAGEFALPLIPFRHMPLAIMQTLLFGTASPTLRKNFEQVWLSLPQSVIVSRLQLLADLDCTESLRSVAAPVLYLQAQQDLLVPTAIGQELRRYCPQMTLQPLPGPHGILQRYPEESWTIISSWLSQQGLSAVRGG